MRRIFGFSIALALTAGFAACGGKGMSPTQPTNGGGGGGGVNTSNTSPVIDGITVLGSRTKEPANYADLGETVAVSAAVHDAETPVDQLQYQWSASAGSFDGTGANVTWTAPSVAATPLTVTLTLTVVETVTQGQQNKTTGTATVLLHNSLKEVGDMARQFLLDFSDSSIRDVPYVMRNFNRAKCPDPREVDSETDDVTNNRQENLILDYRIGPAATTIGFGGHCPFRSKAGDACAVVPSYWYGVDLTNNTRGGVDGNDIIAAVFTPADNRWWLCASDYDGHPVSGSSSAYRFVIR